MSGLTFLGVFVLLCMAALCVVSPVIDARELREEYIVNKNPTRFIWRMHMTIVYAWICGFLFCGLVIVLMRIA